MKRFAIITLTALALTSCASDYSQVSSLQLCDYVLNFSGEHFYQSTQNLYLAELSRRGEDCSGYQHLRR